MLDLATVVDWDDKPHGANRRSLHVHHPHEPMRPTRRMFLKGAMAASAGFALAAMGAFPFVQRGRADAPPGGWLIWTNGGTNDCGGLDSWVNDDECDGCNNKLWCCCSSGYHKGPAFGCNYDFRPDLCKSGGYDGWTWKMTVCCLTGATTCHKNRVWRCSDGKYRSSCSSGWTDSICRYITSSGTTCSGC